MSDVVIQAENISKKYSLRHLTDRRDGLRHAIHRALISPFRKLQPEPPKNPFRTPDSEEFWALRDISFEVKAGEVVGIIGRNGAGKSTLLKILSRITEPTGGRIKIAGRVASLLEVGTGFHAELTGRENIFLNGTILGMSRAEINKKFDEIVAFAEVEKFLDTPVKHYSSGMYVRLAFAVAAHLEPEILIVDEVLAVGDVQFQKKCLGKMQDVSQREGRTILFVSHNMAAVSTLTSRVVLLNKGLVEFNGATREGIDRYMIQNSPQEIVYTAEKSDSKPRITKIETSCSRTQTAHESGKPWTIRFDIAYPYPVSKPSLTFQILNQNQTPVLHFCANDADISLQEGVGVTTVECEIPKLDLNVGSYSINCHLLLSGKDICDIVERACPFDVEVVGKSTLFGWRPNTCTYLVDAVWNQR